MRGSWNQLEPIRTIVLLMLMIRVLSVGFPHCRVIAFLRHWYTPVGFPGGSDSEKNLPAMQETQVLSVGREDPLDSLGQ